MWPIWAIVCLADHARRSSQPRRHAAGRGWTSGEHARRPADATAPRSPAIAGPSTPRDPPIQPPLASPRCPWSFVGRRSSLGKGAEKRQVHRKPTQAERGRIGNSAPRTHAATLGSSRTGDRLHLGWPAADAIGGGWGTHYNSQECVHGALHRLRTRPTSPLCCPSERQGARGRAAQGGESGAAAPRPDISGKLRFLSYSMLVGLDGRISNHHRKERVRIIQVLGTSG